MFPPFSSGKLEFPIQTRSQAILRYSILVCKGGVKQTHQDFPPPPPPPPAGDSRLPHLQDFYTVVGCNFFALCAEKSETKNAFPVISPEKAFVICLFLLLQKRIRPLDNSAYLVFDLSKSYRTDFAYFSMRKIGSGLPPA